MPNPSVQPLTAEELDLEGLETAERLYVTLIARGWTPAETHTIAILHLARYLAWIAGNGGCSYPG